MRAAVPVAAMPARPRGAMSSKDDENFVAHFLGQSRLHFIGSWRSHAVTVVRETLEAAVASGRFGRTGWYCPSLPLAPPLPHSRATDAASGYAHW